MSDLMRVGELAQRHLDGLANAIELAELDAALRRDPAAAQRYVQAACLDADLRRLLRVAAVVPTRRVTRRVQRPAARPRLLPWLAVAALVLLALGVGWWELRPAPAIPAPFAQAGQSLPSGSPLTGEVAITGGGTVTLPAGAQAVAAGTADAPELHLDRGTAICQVASRAGRGPFTVVTPHGRLRVVGTAFTVAVADDTSLAVQDGVVEASTSTASVSVGPGGRTRLATGTAPRLFAAVQQTARTASPADWRNNSPGTVAAAAGTGPTGAPVVRFALGKDAAPWASTEWREGVDWRQGTGISLVVLGTGSGTSWSLELFDNAGPGPRPGGRDTYERFIVTFADDVVGWHERRFPFASFVRRQDLWPGLPNDGLGLGAVHGLSLIAGQPAARITVERIGVYAQP